MCKPLHVAPIAFTGPFRTVRPVQVLVGPCTCLYRSVSACTPCARVCRPLDVAPRACVGPFPLVRHVHMCVGPWAWLHLPVAPRLRLFSRWTPCARVGKPLAVALRACTNQFLPVRPVHVCVRTLDVAPRGFTGPFRPVRPVHGCVGRWTCLYAPIPARFVRHAQCTCV